jgi:hypothetical protein
MTGKPAEYMHSTHPVFGDLTTIWIIVYCRSEKMLTHGRNQYHFGFSSVLTIFGYEKSKPSGAKPRNDPKEGNFAFQNDP